MAKGRKKVSSKQSVGRKRQRELLSSSICRKHGVTAVVTQQVEGGKYVHKCSVCYIEPRNTTITNITSHTLLDLLLRGI